MLKSVSAGDALIADWNMAACDSGAAQKVYAVGYPIKLVKYNTPDAGLYDEFGTVETW